MVSRELAVAKAKELLNSKDDVVYDAKHQKHHFGYIELRALLDFIYESTPISSTELLLNDTAYKY